MRSFSSVHPDHLAEYDSLFTRLRDFYRDKLRKDTPGRERRGLELAEKKLQEVGLSLLSSETFWTALKSVPRGTVLQEVARAAKKTPAFAGLCPGLSPGPEALPFVPRHLVDGQPMEDFDSLEKSLPWPHGMWLQQLRADLFLQATSGDPTKAESQTAKRGVDTRLHRLGINWKEEDFWRVYGKTITAPETPKSPGQALQEVVDRLSLVEECRTPKEVGAKVVTFTRETRR
jgi:hypothetical protein